MSVNSNTLPAPEPNPCPICNGTRFTDAPVLWPELVRLWGLSEPERKYIDRQQGTQCTDCGANIRSCALATAICHQLGYRGTLEGLIASNPHQFLLEINEAGTLHSHLAKFPRYVFGGYPECDLLALPFDTDTFDLVVHSDTLEHVSDPARALGELRRVLLPGGATVFTVPIIIGRMTRSRTGLPGSFHGAPGEEDQEMMVHTEFGADVWCSVLEAGFSTCKLVPYSYPAGIAIVATK